MKNKYFKMTVAIMASMAMVLGLVGCGEGGNSTSTATEESKTAEATNTENKDGNKKIKVEVILKTLASEYWGYAKAGAEAAGKDLGVDVDVIGAASETAYDEQMNMVETALGKNEYDAVIIAPLQADMVSTKIANTKMPIIALDTKIDAPEVLSFVGTGNEEAGKLGGEAAVKVAKEKGWKDIDAILISGVQGDTTAADRAKGYQEGVEAAGGKFLANETQYADAVADKAVTAMEAIMQNHPDGVAIIFGNNDDIAMAARRASKDNPKYKDTVFVGFDGISSACKAIMQDEETMSVSQDAYNMAYMAVEAAVKAVNGEKIEKFISPESKVIDKSNAEERLNTLNGYSK